VLPSQCRRVFDDGNEGLFCKRDALAGRRPERFGVPVRGPAAARRRQGRFREAAQDGVPPPPNTGRSASERSMTPEKNQPLFPHEVQRGRSGGVTGGGVTRAEGRQTVDGRGLSEQKGVGSGGRCRKSRLAPRRRQGEGTRQEAACPATATPGPGEVVRSTRGTVPDVSDRDTREETEQVGPRGRSGAGVVESRGVQSQRTRFTGRR